MAPDPDKEGATIASPYNAGLSGASNQGATHKDLAETVAQRVAQYRTDNGLAADAKVPVDAVTASASGLDPHISVANAKHQVERVAKARGLSEKQVADLLDKQVPYIVYCQSGRRSSAAAFLLAQHGFKASWLRGGLGLQERS